MQKLDFAISTDNDEDGFWSPIFRTIPAFEKTVPDLKSPSCRFMRGLAPFIDLIPPSNNGRNSGSTLTPMGSEASLTLPTTPPLPKHHPYLAMRLRGVIHSIPANPQATSPDENHSIPGWNRIIMVAYKPTKRYLIQVLEHAEEEFGDSFGTSITSQMMQNGTNTTTAQTINQILNGGGAAGQTLDPADIDSQLNTYLRTKLASNPIWRDGTKLDKDAIEEMEEKFRLSEYLDWNDIDYAYAYEGVIIPGGKIMMGRWWRIAPGGEGEGCEWSDALGEEIFEEQDDGGGDAVDVDREASVAGDGPATAQSEASTVAGGHGNGNGNGNGRRRYQKLERGPFIFWC